MTPYSFARIALTAIFFCLFCASWTAAAPFYFNGNWTYRDSQEGEQRESYLQTYGLNLRQNLSDAFSLQEVVRYNRNWEEGSGTTELLEPSMDFNVNNYLFRLDLSGRFSEKRSSASNNITSKSWDGTWTSAWQKHYWPTVRLSIGQDFQEDDQSPRQSDFASIDRAANIGWDLDIAQLTYNYTWRKNTNNVNDSENISTTNFARLDTAKTFWNNRLNLGFAQQYINNRTENTVVGLATGIALIQNTLSQTLYGIDSSPLSNADNPLVGNAALSDGNLDATAVTSDPRDLNLAMKVDFKEVDLIYVYTRDDQSAAAANYQWNIYSSSDATNWSFEVTNAAFTYSAAQKRFEINAPSLKKLYVKVVAVAPTPTGTNVDFTELETYDSTFASVGQKITTEQETTSHLSDINLGLRVSPRVNLAYSLSMEAQRSSTSPEQDRRTQSGSLNWNPSQYLASSLNINESRFEAGDDPAITNRSYSLNFISPPIPTLNISLGATHNDSYEGDSKISSSNIYSFYTTAALYPDLDSNLELTYATTKANTAETKTKNFTSSLTVTARLNPKITADLRGTFANTRTDTSTDSASAAFGVSWRASDLLSLRTTVSETFVENSSDITDLTLNMSLAPTSKNQLTLTSGLNKAESTNENYSLNWRWAVSRFMSTLSSAAYRSSADGDDWSVLMQLRFNFSGFN